MRDQINRLLFENLANVIVRKLYILDDGNQLNATKVKGEKIVVDIHLIIIIKTPASRLPPNWFRRN